MKCFVSIAILCVAVSLAGGCTGSDGKQWYRGNTHTHSLWSDGDATPEEAGDWYHSNGYHFLVMTEHDRIARDERWVTVGDRGRFSNQQLEDLRSRFGREWVVTRMRDGRLEMKLKTLDEVKAFFEEPGEFLYIDGEELGDSAEGKPLHFNALNLAEHIPVQGGSTITENIERNLAAINKQAERLNRPIISTINHTNWKWAVTPEQLAEMDGTHLFELYNGSTGCNNYGDETHPGMDEVWDIALTRRLSHSDAGLLYGLAADDTHNYYSFTANVSHPGRGWIEVRAASLSVESILEAIASGEFYSSTGVDLADVRHTRSRYSVRVAAEDGVTYTIQFIGSRMEDGAVVETGAILQETTGESATYRFSGNELYVRARVVSSKMHASPLVGEEAPEYAWTQPVIPGRK
ncbi:histidinol-phosphatase [Candidatus Zixiibacteriota bacterium]